MLPVVVLAGGLGTRLTDITGDVIPKPMVPVNGRPFLDYKLAGLAREGFEQVLILVGHRGDQIIDHVADGSRWGLSVRCISDGGRPRGTGGALRAVLAELPDAFWATYGDTYLQVDVRAAEQRFVESGASGLMTVLRNRDEWEPSNVRVADGRVVSYTKQPSPGTHDYIDYGMLILERRVVAECTAEEPFDLAAVLEPLVHERRLVAFEVSEPFHDIGTLAALEETAAWLAEHSTSASPQLPL